MGQDVAELGIEAFPEYVPAMRRRIGFWVTFLWRPSEFAATEDKIDPTHWPERNPWETWMGEKTWIR